jgi:hypothetical protein
LKPAAHGPGDGVDGKRGKHGDADQHHGKEKATLGDEVKGKTARSFSTPTASWISSTRTASVADTA